MQVWIVQAHLPWLTNVTFKICLDVCSTVQSLHAAGRVGIMVCNLYIFAPCFTCLSQNPFNNWVARLRRDFLSRSV